MLQYHHSCQLDLPLSVLNARSLEKLHSSPLSGILGENARNVLVSTGDKKTQNTREDFLSNVLYAKKPTRGLTEECGNLKSVRQPVGALSVPSMHRKVTLDASRRDWCPGINFLQVLTRKYIGNALKVVVVGRKCVKQSLKEMIGLARFVESKAGYFTLTISNQNLLFLNSYMKLTT